MKKQNQRSRSQDKIMFQYSEERNVKIYLSEYQSFDIKISTHASIELMKSFICEKIKEFDSREVVGFESEPCDYLFDYRFSKNLGPLNLQETRNLALKCLYKNSTNGSNIDEKQTKNNNNEAVGSSMQKICKYKICKPLSSGGFSRVYLVRNLQNGQFYAAKFMQKSSQANIDREEAILNQFHIHKSLNHPYIVKMQEYIETDQFYVLILEYCPGGELFTLLKNNRYMGEVKAKTIFIQVLLAIQYLHEKNIVFRDIKPQNILIDARGNAKLTDFGLSKEIRGKTNSYCGSVEYMAPQIVSKQAYSLDVDLYCMGALLYEILIGCPPFYNPKFSNNETKYHICKSEVSFPSKIPLSKEVKELIANLLVKNPNQRLGHFQGVGEIFEHPWIGQVQIQNYLKYRVKNPFVPHLDVENFDRQQDQYELNFRKKILQDIKNCKQKSNQSNVNRKQRHNSHLKSKSQSLGVLGQKHLKTKSQQELVLAYSNKRDSGEFKIKPYSKKLFADKQQNPYDYEIKNKSVSQINLGSKEKKQSVFRETNGFKKQKQQKIMSRSFNKTSYNFVKRQVDQQNETKNDKKKEFFINSKSCENSRKSSLHKVTSQGNFVKYAGLTGFTYKLNPHQQSQSSKKSFKELKEKSIEINGKQKSREKSAFKSHPSFMVKSNIYKIKQTKEKEIDESKGLKKNMIKKKFMFSSVKQASVIKTDHFRHELKTPYEQLNNLNRQTLV